MPCAITATQPTETDEGEPFAFDPNGEWAGHIWTGKLVPRFDDDGTPDGTSHEHVIQTLGPPSPGIAFTATTPGRWTVNLSSASDFFGAKSENFYVLAPATSRRRPRSRSARGTRSRLSTSLEATRTRTRST